MKYFFFSPSVVFCVSMGPNLTKQHVFTTRRALQLLRNKIFKTSPKSISPKKTAEVLSTKDGGMEEFHL